MIRWVVADLDIENTDYIKMNITFIIASLVYTALKPPRFQAAATSFQAIPFVICSLDFVLGEEDFDLVTYA